MAQSQGVGIAWYHSPCAVYAIHRRKCRLSRLPLARHTKQQIKPHDRSWKHRSAKRIVLCDNSVDGRIISVKNDANMRQIHIVC